MSISDVLSSADVGVYEEDALPRGDWETSSKVVALKLASYLTEPICKIREYFYTLYILDQMCRATAQKVMKTALLLLGILGCALLTPFTTPLGVLLRGLVSTLQSKPYIYLERGKKGKELPIDKKMTLVSHNQCYMPAGFAITDGQVTPSSDRARMEANLQKVKALDPDVICLFEVADICDADYLTSKLPEYPFLIPVAGVRAIGPSSMIYIASKYEIVKDSIEFVPFEKGTELTGRGQFAEKGFLSFDIRSRGKEQPFAAIISTHLQHSEIPSHPEPEEVKSRGLQIEKILKQIQRKKDLNVVFTGDLNQSEAELAGHLSRAKVDWLRSDPAVRHQPTWGGDYWSADLTGKPPSAAEVLDYTFIAGKTAAISTQIIGTDYSGREFRPEATSDHSLLFSTITCQ